jgi:hypothetical protein
MRMPRRYDHDQGNPGNGQLQPGPGDRNHPQRPVQPRPDQTLADLGPQPCLCRLPTSVKRHLHQGQLRDRCQIGHRVGSQERQPLLQLKKAAAQRRSHNAADGTGGARSRPPSADPSPQHWAGTPPQRPRRTRRRPAHRTRDEQLHRPQVPHQESKRDAAHGDRAAHIASNHHSLAVPPVDQRAGRKSKPAGTASRAAPTGHRPAPDNGHAESRHASSGSTPARSDQDPLPNATVNPNTAPSADTHPQENDRSVRRDHRQTGETVKQPHPTAGYKGRR